MQQQTLIFANFLAPTLHKTYQYVVDFIEQTTGIPSFLLCGESFDDFADGAIDGGFLCGLAYIHLARQQQSPVELLAAPVLHGERYHGVPCYYSDVVVHRASPFQTLADLRGRTWAYNEPGSHSGYNLVCYSLLQQGHTLSFFGRLRETGSHAQSLHCILEGIADATAIDSHLLETVFQQNPRMAAQLRVIGSLGPSTIPPVVVSSQLAPDIKASIRAALLSIHEHPLYTQQLREGRIKCFVPVQDEQYNDIRAMLTRVQNATSPDIVRVG